MKYRYDLRDPMFRVGSIDIQSVARPKNYKHAFRNGREKHGFIYVASGSMLGVFQDCGVSRLRASKGDLIFIPRVAYTRECIWRTTPASSSCNSM